MIEVLAYSALAMSCGGAYWLLGYISRKTYNRLSEGRHR